MLERQAGQRSDARLEVSEGCGGIVYGVSARDELAQLQLLQHGIVALWSQYEMSALRATFCARLHVRLVLCARAGMSNGRGGRGRAFTVPAGRPEFPTESHDVRHKLAMHTPRPLGVL